MPVVPINIGVRSNPGRHGQDSAARLINCYAEEAGAEGKMRFPIYASDGLLAFSALTTADVFYAVSTDFSVNTNSQCLVLIGGIL